METLKQRIEQIIQAYETNEEFTLEHFYVTVRAVTYMDEWSEE